MSELDRNDNTEIADLTERAEKLSRRGVLRAGKVLAFVVPTAAAFTVPRQALGATGSDFGGMMGGGMMGGGMMGGGMMGGGMMGR